MKSRTNSVAVADLHPLFRTILIQCQAEPEPQITVKKSFCIYWLALAAALFLLCLSAHAQSGLPSVPLPPTGKEYGIYGTSSSDVTPMVENICWAQNAYPPGQHFPGYNVFSFQTADLYVSDEKCGVLTNYPWPPPPAGPPYYFTSLNDCYNQQSAYFTGDPNAMYLAIKYAVSAVGNHPEYCNATNKANPTYAVPFTIPYTYDAPWPTRLITTPPLQ